MRELLETTEQFDRARGIGAIADDLEVDTSESAIRRVIERNRIRYALATNINELIAEWRKMTKMSKQLKVSIDLITKDRDDQLAKAITEADIKLIGAEFELKILRINATLNIINAALHDIEEILKKVLDRHKLVQSPPESTVKAIP